MKTDECKYFGLQTCLTLWETRSEDVIRVWVEKSKLNLLKSVLKWCSEKKRGYSVTTNEELEKVSGSVHHEGVCFLAKEKKSISEEVFLKRGKNEGFLYLDGVENPHNLGSIVRTCAHFDFPFILGEAKKMPNLSASACRVAKGGAEFVDLIHLKQPKKTLETLKKQGYSIISTSSHKGESLFSFCFPKKSIIILGSESFGVSEALESLTTHHVQIPGSNKIESLNVSVAASLFLAEYFRQHKGSK